jgi:hypothetical protein
MGVMRKKLLLSVALFWVSQCVLSGCAHKKAVEPLTREALRGKRVALADVRGAGESKTHVEVALVNEVIENGRFEIVDRATVQSALAEHPTDADWQALGKAVGADYVLSVNVSEFNVAERSGLDRVEYEDSVLAEERGERKPVQATRYSRVKSLEGSVKLSALLFDVSENIIVHQGFGSATKTANSRERKVPGKMALLEELSARAMRDFFEKMP